MDHSDVLIYSTWSEVNVTGLYGKRKKLSSVKTYMFHEMRVTTTRLPVIGNLNHCDTQRVIHWLNKSNHYPTL